MNKILTMTSYDPTNVKLILGGYEPYGFATDSKLTLARAEDLILPVVGTDNDLSTALNRNSLGTLTLTLQHTSPSNGVFANWHQLVKTTRMPYFPVLVEDPSSGLAIVSGVGWVQTQPELALGKEVSEMPWVIGIWQSELSGSLATAGFAAMTGISVG